MAAPKSKKFVSPLSASERVLGDGSVVVPGTEVELDDEALKDEHTARLIEEGQLLEVEEKATPKKDGGE